MCSTASHVCASNERDMDSIRGIKMQRNTLKPAHLFPARLNRPVSFHASNLPGVRIPEVD